MAYKDGMRAVARDKKGMYGPAGKGGTVKGARRRQFKGRGDFSSKPNKGYKGNVGGKKGSLPKRDGHILRGSGEHRKHQGNLEKARLSKPEDRNHNSLSASRKPVANKHPQGMSQHANKRQPQRTKDRVRPMPDGRRKANHPPSSMSSKHKGNWQPPDLRKKNFPKKEGSFNSKKPIRKTDKPMGKRMTGTAHTKRTPKKMTSKRPVRRR
ncbi:hypothetical protein ACFL0T_04590 [Candidatus Omnitrophota bacterium]